MKQSFAKLTSKGIGALEGDIQGEVPYKVMGLSAFARYLRYALLQTL